MRRWFALATALSAPACNQVFGLDPPTRADAGDGARDGAIDALTPDADATCASDPGGAPDEDGDGLRDACDLCPQLAGDDDDFDNDHDGVGDGCDPHPAAADELLAFYGFSDATRPPAFTYRVDALSPSGSWDVAGGDLYVTGLAPDSDALAELPVGRAAVTVDTIFRLEEDPAPQQVIGVWSSIDPQSVDRERPAGMALVIATLSMTTTDPTLVLHDWPTGRPTSGFLDPVAFTRGARIRLVFTCDESPAAYCVGTAYDLINGPKTVVATDGIKPPPTLRDGAVGLRAFAVPAAFEYLAVYGRR